MSFVAPEHTELLSRIDEWFEMPADSLPEDARRDFQHLLEGLESGTLRAAMPPDSDSHGDQTQPREWQVVASVKRGILLGFRLGTNEVMHDGGLLFSDKSTYPLQRLPVVERNIRLVPGGNSVRRGAYLGQNVTMMPPAFVNVGAYVDEGTMIDSHALVGSCAQIGKGVHLSAGAQVGGVLEPIGQSPVIVGDNALIGGNTGLYEGVQIGRGAVIGAGCVLTASTPVYDLVHQRILRATEDAPLRIPPMAVVVPGSRPAKGVFAKQHGLQLAALLIVKYRDSKTDTRTALEEALR